MAMPRFRGCFAGFKGESPNLLTAFALSPQQDKAMKNTYTLDASAMIHLASRTIGLNQVSHRIHKYIANKFLVIAVSADFLVVFLLLFDCFQTFGNIPR